MKWVSRVLLSLFFAVSIGVHIYYIIESDSKPFWWHMIYFTCYGICWWMIFSKNKMRSGLYAVMSIFPFASHVYYGYRHLSALDGIFWVCVLVCVMLPLGFLWIRYEDVSNL